MMQKLLILLLTSSLIVGCTGKKKGSAKEDIPPPKEAASEQAEQSGKMTTLPPATCDDQFYKKQKPSLPSTMTSDNQDLCFNGFSVVYSSKTKTPLYSAEQLTRERLRMSENLNRIDNFHEEQRIDAAKRAKLDDYAGSGYDRGHLSPNADMYDRKSQYDSFSLANIAPQTAILNRGVWSRLESSVRGQAKRTGMAYVVTGVLYKAQAIKSLNGVLVPSHFYKAVYYPTTRQGLVYLATNTNKPTIQKMTFLQFKQWTDIDLMPSLTEK